MENVFVRSMRHRLNYLKTIISRMEKNLKSAPAGNLRCAKHRGKAEYYWREKSYNYGKYIKKEQFPVAAALAQKDYDSKILTAATQESELIETLLSLYPDQVVEAQYDTLSPMRQPLVKPILLSDQKYAEAWQSKQYVGKSFAEGDPDFRSAKKERMRSKSEIIIADTLMRRGVPYRYEYPVNLRGLGIVHPDFTILNLRLRKEVIWEHFGKMDDPDYCNSQILKLNKYMQNGFFLGDNLIVTLESARWPLNNQTIDMVIDKYCL